MFSFDSVNDTIVEKFEKFLLIQTNKIIWDNSLIIPLDDLDLKNNSFLEIKCSVIIGKIGIGIVGNNFSKYLFNEIFVDKRSNIKLEIPINTKSKNLIIRNVTNKISKYKFMILNLFQIRIIKIIHHYPILRIKILKNFF